LTVGRLKTYKNVQRAIGAMPFLDERYHLVIVGDGPARAKLASLAADMRVEDRVRFLGTIATADLYRWYRTAAVYLALSRQEAFGVTVLEALAGGARPLLSDIPAHREILDQVGYSGPALVPLDIAPRTLAERIVATADQPAPDLDSLRLPTWDGVAEQTMALYAAAACVSP
jgi:glycosyltransferase involved in cell wall biosynthesis